MMFLLKDCLEIFNKVCQPIPGNRSCYNDFVSAPEKLLVDFGMIQNFNDHQIPVINN